MYYTIYQVTNIVNGKKYVGKHQTRKLDDDYLGSGVALLKAIKKHGRSSFIKEILFVFDNEDEMNNKERELITEEFVSSKYTYNKGVGGEGGPHFKGKSHSIETRKKISKSRKGLKLSRQAREKISEANRKRKLSDETKRKLSEKAKNSWENRKKLRVREVAISPGS